MHLRKKTVKDMVNELRIIMKDMVNELRKKEVANEMTKKLCYILY
jgi:hypothetical protein